MSNRPIEGANAAESSGSRGLRFGQNRNRRFGVVLVGLAMTCIVVLLVAFQWRVVSLVQTEDGLVQHLRWLCARATSRRLE
jgi:hypothetical protein